MTCDDRGLQSPAGRPLDAGGLLHRLQATHPFPLSVLFAITERCHLRCEHCYLPPEDQQSELSLAEIERLLDELAELGVLFLIVTGGDPSQRRDLEQIVAAAVDRRFSVRLKTSATLLDKTRVEALVEAGLSEVHVSVYDDRPEVHDAVVGLPGAWQRSMAAMKRFAEKGVLVKMATLVTRRNAERISRLVDLAERNGFEYVIDPHVFPRTDGDLAPIEFRPAEAQLTTVMEDERLFDRAAFGEAFPRDQSSPPCTAGRDAVYVMPDGRVGLCPMLPMELGNVRDRSFREIWLESTARRQIADMTWSDLPDCSACDDAWACIRCPAVALIETGDLTGVAPADCAIARARAGVSRR